MKRHPNIKIIEVLKLMEPRRNQRWLAKQSGVPESYISMIVNGRLVPSMEQQTAISRALNVERQQIFE